MNIEEHKALQSGERYRVIFEGVYQRFDGPDCIGEAMQIGDKLVFVPVAFADAVIAAISSDANADGADSERKSRQLEWGGKNKDGRILRFNNEIIGFVRCETTDEGIMVWAAYLCDRLISHHRVTDPEGGNAFYEARQALEAAAKKWLGVEGVISNDTPSSPTS